LESAEGLPGCTSRVGPNVATRVPDGKRLVERAPARYSG
jgi:hypothetical protein